MKGIQLLIWVVMSYSDLFVENDSKLTVFLEIKTFIWVSDSGITAQHSCL